MEPVALTCSHRSYRAWLIVHFARDCVPFVDTVPMQTKIQQIFTGNAPTQKMDTEMIQTKKAKQASSKTIRVHLLFLMKLSIGNAI